MRTCQMGEVPNKEATFAQPEPAEGEEFNVIMYPACEAEGTEEVEGVFFCPEHHATGKAVYDGVMAEAAAEAAALGELLEALVEAFGAEDDLSALFGPDISGFNDDDHGVFILDI